MPKDSLQPRLDLPSSERLGELIGGVKEARLGHRGQTLAGAAEPAEPSIAIPARRQELQQLLGASIDQNRHITAHVRRLEVELRRSSAEVAKLRGELRGAVQDALTDPLTGLANRRSFDMALRRIAARVGTSSLAHLVMADIDHFKRVNDVHGHDVGDEVLRIVGEVLLAHVRRDNLVARVGGDEFGIVLPGTSPHNAAGIATRLCALLASRRLFVRGQPEVTERFTLSIGVAAAHAGESSGRWFARADAALYEAKRGGRNRVVFDLQGQAAPEARRLRSVAAW
jgi:diguanylate cyclase